MKPTKYISLSNVQIYDFINKYKEGFKHNLLLEVDYFPEKTSNIKLAFAIGFFLRSGTENKKKEAGEKINRLILKSKKQRNENEKENLINGKAALEATIENIHKGIIILPKKQR
eukprot:TRINITY_DN6254_c0_g1_i2.p1 TRINITY_DN6254_c0_g1~~TRINITY_DN6254_c0_g1_i2.p1  ORF type:complete len:114 (-),score=31.68 TRINITY_DN6254_c0_g1_i2:115-456(-)